MGRGVQLYAPTGDSCVANIFGNGITYQAILAEGRAEGVQEGIRLVAINLLKEGTSVEVVAKVTRLTVEQVQQLEITNPENTEQ